MNRVKHGALLALAAATVASGCTTFSDNDAVARVDDAELSADDLRERLATYVEGEAVSADEARDVINGWILEQVGADPVEVYPLGAESSGSVCVEALVVETEDAASAAMAMISDAASFDAVFTDQNVDPSIGNGGNLGCVGLAELPIGQGNPFVDALPALSAADPLTSIGLPNELGEIDGYVIARFQSYDELDEEGLDIVAANLPIDPASVEAADVYIDPRYGTFDPQFGAVSLG